MKDRDILRMVTIRTKWEEGYPDYLYTFFYENGKKAYRYETPYTIKVSDFTDEEDEHYKRELQSIRNTDGYYRLQIQKFNKKGKMIKEYNEQK